MRVPARDAARAAGSGSGSALVAIAPPPPVDRSRFVPFRRPDAAVIAHLFAMRDGDAQTREKRRAEPAVAVTAYRSAAALLDRAVPAVRRTV